MNIAHDVTFNIWADQDYHYAVSGSADGELAITYHEDRDGNREEVQRLSFGSLDEMEAVAEAMLKVVELARSK